MQHEGKAWIRELPPYGYGVYLQRPNENEPRYITWFVYEHEAYTYLKERYPNYRIKEASENA